MRSVIRITFHENGQIVCHLCRKSQFLLSLIVTVRGISRKKIIIVTKSEKRDIFLKIFLGNMTFVRIIEEIDKIGKVEDV